MSKSQIVLEPPTTDSRQSREQFDHQLPKLDLEPHGGGKSYWWVWLLIFGAITYGCYRLYTFEQTKKEGMVSARGAAKPRMIPVVAATAHSGNMPVYLEGLGNVAPYNTVTVHPREDGQLIRVTFQEGQQVKKGDLLAELDPRPFQVAMGQAQGNLAQAKGALARDEAALRDAQANYSRYEQLFNEKIIAKQQLDTQLAAVDQIRGTIQADQATIAGAQAAIDSANLNLSYTRITAPISGRIGLRQVDAGNMVHTADTNGIAVIAQLQPIAVLFSIPQDQLPEVLDKLHAGAKLRVDAYDRDQKQMLEQGTLETVDNEIDPTTGTSRLKAVFPNTDLKLFPNQFVNARLSLGSERNVVIVPAVAIQRGPSGTFVYVVQQDSSVAVRPVKVGMTQGNDMAVDQGLASGDRVVIDGAEKLTDGMKVSTSRR